MIEDACLNEKQAYDYGRAHNQIKNKNLGGWLTSNLSYGLDTRSKTILLFLMILWIEK